MTKLSTLKDKGTVKGLIARIGQLYDWVLLRVIGPDSSTDNAIARFNGTDGKNIQNSSAQISDAGLLSANSFQLNDPGGALRQAYTITNDGPFKISGTENYSLEIDIVPFNPDRSVNVWQEFFCYVNGINIESLRIGHQVTFGEEFFIQANQAGDGVSKPINIYTDGNRNQLVLEIDGSISIYNGSLKTNIVTPIDLSINCGSGKTLELVEPVYEDLQSHILNVKKPPSSSPTTRYYNHGIVGGVTFPVEGFAVGDYVDFDIQTHHSMKLSTVLGNHIHFMTPTDGSGTPDRFQFQLDVIVAPIGGSWTVPSGSPFTSEHIIAADYTNSHILMGLADIPASNTTVSTIYSCKLTRIASTQDEYGQEVYIKFNDSHYQKNTMGSRLKDEK